jgi:hypothetical protein
LQDWTQEQVVFALRKWNRDKPDSEPTPGHILAMMKELRGRKVAASLPKHNQTPETPAIERHPVSRERAAQIMREAGIRIKGIDPGDA